MHSTAEMLPQPKMHAALKKYKIKQKCVKYGLKNTAIRQICHKKDIVINVVSLQLHEILHDI